MDTDQTTICTSQNVHIGQEVVIYHHTYLGNCSSSNDGVVTAVDPEHRTYTVSYQDMRGREAYTISDQWYGDGWAYCVPAAEVYGG